MNYAQYYRPPSATAQRPKPRLAYKLPNFSFGSNKTYAASAPAPAQLPYMQPQPSIQQQQTNPFMDMYLQQMRPQGYDRPAMSPEAMQYMDEYRKQQMQKTLPQLTPNPSVRPAEGRPPLTYDNRQFINF